MKRIFILSFAFMAFQISSCNSSGDSIDGKIYQIYIKNQPWNIDGNYANEWENTDASKMRNAVLYRSLNPNFEYGHITIATWDNFEELKKAHNYQGKPADKLHRVYKKINEVIGSSKQEGYTVITVFDFPKDLAGNNDLRPNWESISSWMKDKKGFIGADFYECLSPDVTYRYINIANWEDHSEITKIIEDDNNFFNEIIENSTLKQKTKSSIFNIIKTKNHE